MLRELFCETYKKLGVVVTLIGYLLDAIERM